MKAINEKIKELREKSGFRQSQIAEFLGVTQTYISKIESGERKITVDQLERLASLYGYSLDMFVNMPDEVQPISIAFRAQDANLNDLSVVADIGRIAINSSFMSDLLEETDD